MIQRRTDAEIVTFIAKEIAPAIEQNQKTLFLNWPVISRWFGMSIIFVILFWQFPRFPSLMQLEPGLERLIRFGLLTPAGLAFVGGITAIFRGVGLRGRARRTLQRELKTSAAEFLFPDLKFNAAPAFPVAVYRASSLFPMNYDRGYAGSQFEGTYSGIRFSMVDVHTQKESSDSDGDTSVSDIWKGILVLVEPVGPRAELTIVQGHPTGTFVGKLLHKIQSTFRPLKVVNLADPDFEKEFACESVNPGAAGALLTPERRKRLIALREEWGPDLRVSFFDDQAVFALPSAWSLLGKDFDLEKPGQSLNTLDTTVRAILEIVAYLAKA
jgi:hypothetical protein